MFRVPSVGRMPSWHIPLHIRQAVRAKDPAAGGRVKLFKREQGRSSRVPAERVAIRFDDGDPIPGLMADAQLVEIDVVGESYRQDALARIAGARTDLGKHHAVGTTLRCDPKNEHDSNAIRVECMGQLLGFIPREVAAVLAPALSRHGGAAEAVGVIVGGWDNGDSVGSYGVRVWLPQQSLLRIGVDPESVRRDAFTRSDPTPSDTRVRMDTGFSHAWAMDQADDDYDLSWYEELPEADRPAIAMLRGLLLKSSDAIDRHFQFAELEHRIYRCRDLYDDALDEFEEVCKAHDSEMDDMHVVFLEKWGCVPRLTLYRQMAIRKSKAHDYHSALWWAERGLAVYGDNAAHEAAVEDLTKRRNRARAKISPALKPPRTARVATPTESQVEHLVCLLCGAMFERAVVKGRKPHLCPDCRATGHDAAEVRRASSTNVEIDRLSPAQNGAAPNWKLQRPHHPRTGIPTRRCDMSFGTGTEPSGHTMSPTQGFRRLTPSVWAASALARTRQSGHYACR